MPHSSVTRSQVLQDDTQATTQLRRGGHLDDTHSAVKQDTEGGLAAGTPTSEDCGGQRRNTAVAHLGKTKTTLIRVNFAVHSSKDI
jgi:hypothetical protein